MQQHSSETHTGSLSSILWPRVARLRPAELAALLKYLDATQWWSPQRIRDAQFEQLGELLGHAWRNTIGYRDRLAAAGYTPGTRLNEETWSSIPILTRADLQETGSDFCATPVPQDHGRVVHLYSSGSSGTPVHTRGTELTNFLWQASTLREHLWQQRDTTLKLVGLRPDRLRGARESRMPTWGKPARQVFETGPSAMLDSSVPIPEQLDWLRKERPGYLNTLPSNLRALAQHAQQSGATLADLREIRCYGEVVSDELRALVRAAFGVKVTASYGAQEVGTLALQAPFSNAYYVQAETMLVEVLDASGRPCAPGETGRVIVTPLHNFAMPLLRYELKDYAQVGKPLADGRGLPVLERVFGRVRNILRTPEGKTYWPSFPMRSWSEIAEIRQLQLVQTHIDRVCVNLVMPEPLTGEQQALLRARLHKSLNYPFHIEFNYLADIPRKPDGKYENFVSRLDGGDQAGGAEIPT